VGLVKLFLLSCAVAVYGALVIGAGIWVGAILSGSDLP
jgi:hypothetical protein